MQTPQEEQVQFRDLISKGKLTVQKSGKGQNQESVQLSKPKSKNISKVHKTVRQDTQERWDKAHKITRRTGNQRGDHIDLNKQGREG